ncbi:cell number regulator 8-like [Aristolochia californica]|uniref:cell number regulator 8-like n=1 Tax=Aristolochia californica TaxID=171875 RepID=UPI0035E0CD8D
MVNPEEESPLLPAAGDAADAKRSQVEEPLKVPTIAVESPPPRAYGWTAEGLPCSHFSAIGEPVPRRQWDSSILACLGRNDEFCSSDLEVCLLGSLAPCMLYGSNVERLGSNPGSFANHCLPYTGLYLLGNSLFGWNCMAPWFSYPSRTAIRRKFNLEGSCEALVRSCGCCCCKGLLKDDEHREQCETACDFATHFFCHPCSLCQEARELRRRLPHPGFNSRSVLIMVPPAEQSMGRGA